MKRRQLPAASLYVLVGLLDGEKHGYAVMRDVEQLSDGAVKMGPGTLYGTLNRLLNDGLIEEVLDRTDDEPGDERRRYYRLTRDGVTATHDELSRLRLLLQRATTLFPGLDGGVV